MARIYDFVKQHVVSLLARGELISSKPSKEQPNPRAEILEELVGTPREQPIGDGVSKGESALEPNRPIVTASTDAVIGLRRQGDSPQPGPLRPSHPADHKPRVFIRSRL